MSVKIPDELYADLALIKGKIATMNKDDSIVEAVACKSEKIIKVGTTEEIKTYIGKHTRVIDLEGKLVTPGFIDSHNHFSWTGRDVRLVNLRHVHSIDALIDELKKRAETLPKYSWIEGYGYHETKLKEKRHPNRYELDKASTDHPIKVERKGGHDGIRVNSLALKLAGISKNTPDPDPPSFIERERDTKEPLGNLREKAAKPVTDLIAKAPGPTRDEIKQGLIDGNNQLLEWGITSMQEAGAPMDFLPIYRELINEGKLQVRNSFLIAAPRLGRTYNRNEGYNLAVDLSIEAGYSTHFGDNHLKFAGIKLGHDGSMSAGNCAVYEPYLNDSTPDNYGVVHGYSNEELKDGRALAEFSPLVIKLHKAGMRCGIGAIGDRGIDFFLDAIETAHNKDPKPDARHSLEHCSLPTLGALERMKRLKVNSSTSVGFGWDFGDQHRGYMGMERMKRYMPMKSFKEMGIVASGNADWPICPANVFEGIHVCVNRTSETGQDLGQNQAISVMDAIKVYTWNGAYITFDEDIKGSIEEGKLADIVILDTDILTCHPSEIVKTKVTTTILDGKIVYQRD